MQQLEERQGEIEISIVKNNQQRFKEKQAITDKHRPLIQQRQEENDPINKLEERRNLGEVEAEKRLLEQPPNFNTNINMDLVSILATTML